MAPERTVTVHPHTVVDGVVTLWSAVVTQNSQHSRDRFVTKFPALVSKELARKNAENWLSRQPRGITVG
jgi:hypothetical protein